MYKGSRSTLTWWPVTGVNYGLFLEKATEEEIKGAIEYMRNSKGNKDRIAACERELRRRGRK